MVDFFNVWDIITSILSLSATFLVAYVYHQLPSKRMDALFSLLDKTDGHFKSCVEQGLLDAAAAAEFERQINALRTRTKNINLKVACAGTWYEDVANMFKGLTKEINWMCQDVNKVGAAISVPSVAASTHEETPPRPSTNEEMEGPSMRPTDWPAHWQQQESSQRDAEPLQMPVDMPPPTPSPAPPHRTSTQESCNSQASTHASSIVPTPRRKRSIPAHRSHHWVHFVRQPRGRWSLQSQKSDIIELLGTPTVLVDEPEEDCEWEDVPARPLELAIA
ncbi:hypothetical protein TRAPUB_10175 [Trametes pubescens]|uniref:Uncharacterized protein n=1 Tax=Trametes pubescens TaxID=154538 RepID=A0A1M2W0I4_TRAPU|nr:hypothetical protein TRAPUB_10175 [Trametes pubescens]